MFMIRSTISGGLQQQRRRRRLPPVLTSPARAVPDINLKFIRFIATASILPSPVRVRFAPSPTGYLHLGGLRTALFNFLFAHAAKRANPSSAFILRIEDTDVSRYVPGAVEAMKKSLEWSGLTLDEGPGIGGQYGPYVQSERFAIYKSYAEKLIQTKHGYYCFCTPKRLELLRKGQQQRGEVTQYDRACRCLDAKTIANKLAANLPYTIRLAVPQECTDDDDDDDDDGSSTGDNESHRNITTVHDHIKGYVQFQNTSIDDSVLLKTDGYPTYHLANVVDDHLMEITHVIRGEEWLPSTPKHLLLYKAFGWTPPVFCHLGLLLNRDRSKLSKRQGDVAVEDFAAKGYLAPALINFTALLGWNPAHGETQEIFTLQELINRFDLTHVNKAGSVMDIDRLKWMNATHVSKLLDLAPESIVTAITLKLKQADSKSESESELANIDPVVLLSALRLVKDKITLIDDFVALTRFFFHPPDLTTPDACAMRLKVWEEDTDAMLRTIHHEFEQLPSPDFTSHTLMSVLKRIKREYCKKSLSSVFMPVRYCLTGMPVGANITETAALLGQDVCLFRLKHYHDS